MFRVSIKFLDGSKLSDIFLYKESFMYDSIILDSNEFIDTIQNRPWTDLHFGNNNIQGHFIVSGVESYEINEIPKENFREELGCKLYNLLV